MTEKEAYIAFNLVEGFGAVKVAALAAQCGGSVADAYALLPADQRRDWRGNDPDWRSEIARAARMHVAIITPADPEYPPRLRDLASPPLALYVFGSVAALAAPSVAIVGTRRLTAYGADVADRFAAGLAQAGWSIISGLALGADTAAHRGALAVGGVTVGVLGGALDEFFPSENRTLGRQMAAARGAVVTEFPFGRKPDKTTFPQRNRIVAALASGVLAVECPRKSGTLITCGFAADLGRTVLAVPGRVDSPSSAGCNALIRDGARLVASVDDVLEELAPLARPSSARKAPPAVRVQAAAPTPSPAAPARPKRAPAAPEVTLTPEEALVMRNLGDSPMALDNLVRSTGLPAARLNTIVVQLRIKRQVRLHPGNRVGRYA